MIIKLVGLLALCISIAIILGGGSMFTSHKEKGNLMTEKPLGNDQDVEG